MPISSFHNHIHKAQISGLWRGAARIKGPRDSLHFYSPTSAFHTHHQTHYSCSRPSRQVCSRLSFVTLASFKHYGRSRAPIASQIQQLSTYRASQNSNCLKSSTSNTPDLSILDSRTSAKFQNRNGSSNSRVTSTSPSTYHQYYSYKDGTSTSFLKHLAKIIVGGSSVFIMYKILVEEDKSQITEIIPVAACQAEGPTASNRCKSNLVPAARKQEKVVEAGDNNQNPTKKSEKADTHTPTQEKDVNSKSKNSSELTGPTENTPPTSSPSKDASSSDQKQEKVSEGDESPNSSNSKQSKKKCSWPCKETPAQDDVKESVTDNTNETTSKPTKDPCARPCRDTPAQEQDKSAETNEKSQKSRTIFTPCRDTPSKEESDETPSRDKEMEEKEKDIDDENRNDDVRWYNPCGDGEIGEEDRKSGGGNDKKKKVTLSKEPASQEEGKAAKVNSNSQQSSEKLTLAEAIDKTKELCKRKREEVGSPGIVVCVSVDGKHVYAEGFGYADLENCTPMLPSSVLRIASISKAITATIVARMWEEGHLRLENAVQRYVPTFPEKEFLGQRVDITVEQLLNHTSGIRHYKQTIDPADAFQQDTANIVALVKESSRAAFFSVGPNSRRRPTLAIKKHRPKKADNKKEVSEMERDEYYLTSNFPTTKEALSLFANDPLVAKPGSKFIYTTFAYTLLAAIVESVTKQPFRVTLTNTLKDLGMRESYLDQNDPIIYHRARYYVKDTLGKIKNAPYVDLSYKWAGGGVLSTAEDVVRFGNALLYSAQHKDGDPGLRGYLKSSTVWKFWVPQERSGTNRYYGLGFEIAPAKEQYGTVEPQNFGVGHTGGAVGASSALYILPRPGTIQESDVKGQNSETAAKKGSAGESGGTETKCKSKSVFCKVSDLARRLVVDNEDKEAATQIALALVLQSLQEESGHLPKGVVVSVLVNMISVSVWDTAENIARLFEKVELPS